MRVSAIALLVLAGIHTWLLRVPPSFSVGAIIIIFMWASISQRRRLTARRNVGTESASAGSLIASPIATTCR